MTTYSRPAHGPARGALAPGGPTRGWGLGGAGHPGYLHGWLRREAPLGLIARRRLPHLPRQLRYRRRVRAGRSRPSAPGVVHGRSLRVRGVLLCREQPIQTSRRRPRPLQLRLVVQHELFELREVAQRHEHVEHVAADLVCVSERRPGRSGRRRRQIAYIAGWRYATESTHLVVTRAWLQMPPAKTHQ